MNEINFESNTVGHNSNLGIVKLLRGHTLYLESMIYILVLFPLCSKAWVR